MAGGGPEAQAWRVRDAWGGRSDTGQSCSPLEVYPRRSSLPPWSRSGERRVADERVAGRGEGEGEGVEVLERVLAKGSMGEDDAGLRERGLTTVFLPIGVGRRALL